jgi:cytochrome c peroxidase
MKTAASEPIPIAQRWLRFYSFVAFVILLACLGSAAAWGAPALVLQLVPKFNGAPLNFDSLTDVTAAGQRISVTRLDFLMSDFALRRVDGTWIEQTNWFAYIHAREGQTRAEFPQVPSGNYDRMRFLVGLKPEINHAPAAKFPAGHPLNPEVNGLYWGWMGGYVFLALEGDWLRPNGVRSGYSFHLATDRQLMTVELPITLDMSSATEIRVALNVEKIFGGAKPLTLDDATDSTHSRTNDWLAEQLRKHVCQAFEVEQIFATPAPKIAARETTHFEMAPGAKPYPLSFSAFFPQPALPRDNPLTREGVRLGERLFHDRQLSVNDTQSCASCHREKTAFTDGRAVSLGAEGQLGTRNAMGLFNLAWKSSYFWDGRAASLREQVLQPMQNPLEMHESLSNIVSKLTADADYPQLFADAFGTPEITADRIARTLEQFLLTQVSCDSKFDRVIAGEAKFTALEQRGFILFHTEYDPRRGQFGADCFHCHGGPLFQSQSFANNGLDTNFPDAGRFRVTGRAGDEGKFAVPSLRNVELTAPFMHDGRFKTLEEAVAHYCTGMKRSATLDPNLAKHPDGGVPLDEADQRALVAFLKTLTDERFRESIKVIAANPVRPEFAAAKVARKN